MGYEDREHSADYKIYVVRHGESFRSQAKCKLEEANDLTEEGMSSARKVAVLIATEGYYRNLRVMSSPYGRTLHTAKIIVGSLNMISELNDQGYPNASEELLGLLEKTAATESVSSVTIEPTDRLEKARGFQWELVKPLIMGGVIEFGGRTLSVDPSLTNPYGHDYHTYLVHDELKKIPGTVKRLWPREYVDFLEGVETFESLSHRMIEMLGDIDRKNDPLCSHLLSTHGALMGFLSFAYSRQYREEIKPGEVVTLEKRGKHLLVTGAGALAHANGRYVDIFEEHQRRFG
jgi:broad specificity phosphatase PhoE